MWCEFLFTFGFLGFNFATFLMLWHLISSCLHLIFVYNWYLFTFYICLYIIFVYIWHSFTFDMGNLFLFNVCLHLGFRSINICSHLLAFLLLFWFFWYFVTIVHICLHTVSVHIWVLFTYICKLFWSLFAFDFCLHFNVDDIGRQKLKNHDHCVLVMTNPTHQNHKMNPRFAFFHCFLCSLRIQQNTHVLTLVK